MACVVGIDIAKKTFDVATRQGNGTYRTRSQLANDASGFKALRTWLTKYAEPRAWIVIEATGHYHQQLAAELHEHGYQVSVVNPACIAYYAKSQLQRIKTDKADAKLIARYGECHSDTLRMWQPAPWAQRKLCTLLRRIEDLQKLERMEHNRLDVATDASEQASIECVLEQLQTQITELLAAVEDHIAHDASLRHKRNLLTSIGGISNKTAALLLAELGDPLLFDDAREIVAFAGLNPKLAESGQQKGTVRISRTGSARLRAGLYMPAIVAMTHNPAIKALKERLRTRGKAGKQIVCAAMRKLLHLVYGVLKSGQPFDPALAIAH
ncbi:IS110 family RNA-guided transposase [Salinisphaera orenii]|uniref:IS110 family transposase n=1 Tax=Salinisphaera orenii TaxID=856731 RepID=UPI000DBE2C68